MQRILSGQKTNGIKLIGSGEGDCFIDGGSLASVIRFEEDLGGIIDSTTLITGFTIQNGYAQQSDWLNFDGGGMFLYASSPTLTDVTFRDNAALNLGGGMRIYASSPTLTDVTFSGNMAYSGGGMELNRSSPTLTGVTFSGNMAGLNGGGMYLNSSSPTLTNSILWGNSPEEISFLGNNDPSSIAITYSDIQGGVAGIVTNDNGTVYWEVGNIDADPLFTDSENGDYTLQASSPCIDVGTSNIEIAEELFADNNSNGIWDEGEEFTDKNQNGIYDTSFTIEIPEDDYCGTAPDMGAYEYITEDCGELSVAPEIPLSYQIQPAYPNPFNPTTTISFSIPEFGLTTITAYDITGKELETLTNEVLSIGNYSINWNADNLPSGVYLIRMDSGDFTQTQKVVLVK